MPQHDVDVLETSRHLDLFEHDLRLLRACNVTRLRYPVRWHRVEAEPHRYDWGQTDRLLGRLADQGFIPIVDLVHHTSYPRWLTRGFGDARFKNAYLRYCEQFALRYDWITEYTLFNEPFATLFLCGHEAIWPPYESGIRSLVQIFENVLPAIAEAGRMYGDLLPKAKHLYVDTCEGHRGTGSVGGAYAEMANDRRFFVLDALLGSDLDPDRPFLRALVDAGGESLLSIEPLRVDVLGLDYYAHSEWYFTDTDGRAPSSTPQGLAALVLQYQDRYQLPMILSETNIRGYAPDRVSWLKYTLEQCETAIAAGACLSAYCWFPFIDSLDWDSLLARPTRHVDPVGVYLLDDDLVRTSSSMSHWYGRAASGATAAEIPAYRFEPPVDEWLRGFLPQMSHWDWIDPPAHEVGPDAAAPGTVPVSEEAALGR